MLNLFNAILWGALAVYDAVELIPYYDYDALRAPLKSTEFVVKFAGFCVAVISFTFYTPIGKWIAKFVGKLICISICIAIVIVVIMFVVPYARSQM
eukprot:UN07871